MSELLQKPVRIKANKKLGRKPGWGLVLQHVTGDGVEFYWVERHDTGGKIPLQRADFVVKRDDRHAQKFFVKGRTVKPGQHKAGGR